ncbi:50S ribosomal protein L25 [Candidatus Parcubacteria bacterium]|nr:50S ribosomal protein L25 [Candidatus Parcubacteria bacterium]
MSHTLVAEARAQKGRKTNYLRAEGKVPAIVYGSGTQPTPITVDRNAFLKIYKEAGESSLVELKVGEDKALHVLIQDYQIDPVYDHVTHVDFRSVDMTKEIEADVDLNFIGESMAVKGLGGTLVTSREDVTVRCLPSKLVRSISVDLSKLATFEDVIRVSDLLVPEGVMLLEEPDASIAIVEPPRSEAELAALEGAVEENVQAVEVEGAKKDEEGAEDEKNEKKSA